MVRSDNLVLLDFYSVNMVVIVPYVLRDACSMNSFGMKRNRMFSNDKFCIKLGLLVCKERIIWNHAVFYSHAKY